MSDIEVKAEPLTYALDAPASYFRDLALARNGDTGATARQAQHAKEMRVELPKFEARAKTAPGMEYRVNPNRTPGQGGFGAPPLWLISHAAGAPRPGRVLADMIPSFALPSGVSSVNLPRLATGTRTGVTPDLSAVLSQDVVDALVTSPVTPIVGQGDIALQALEQSPASASFDHAIFLDLAADYDAQLETLLINGSGVGNQFLGILNVPAGAGLANAVTYSDGTPTAAEMVPFIGQTAAKVGNTRMQPPETWLMRTSRFAWLNVFDATGRPTVILPILGFPHALDDVIPTNVGGAGQDAIIACRPSDMLLLESTQTTSVDVQSVSGTLEVRLQLRGYAAALVARYPTGIGTLTGSGMAIASGF